MNDSLDVVFSNSYSQVRISLFLNASFCNDDTHKEKINYFLVKNLNY